MDAIAGSRARSPRALALAGALVAGMAAGCVCAVVASPAVSAAPARARGVSVASVRRDYTNGSDSGSGSGSGSGSAPSSGSVPSSGSAPSAGPAPDAATLVQCQTAGEQVERSATFAGEMTTIAGTARMAMRIELLERAPGETGYHPVLAPGVGVWRAADPGVKTYKHLEQVTNLAAPAYYRALITFRWDGAHGRVLRREERRSPRCAQPAPATSPAPTGAGAGAPLE